MEQSTKRPQYKQKYPKSDSKEIAQNIKHGVSETCSPQRNRFIKPKWLNRKPLTFCEMQKHLPKDLYDTLTSWIPKGKHSV
jgi:hypothetical protein